MSSHFKFLARWSLLSALFVIPTVVRSQNAFSPGGEDYKIAGALVGDQTFPRAAISASGGFLVWQDNGVDGDGLGIKAERLNQNLIKTGQQFRVNVEGANDQEKPQVALLQDGGAVIVWQGGKYGFQKIYARFIAPNGSFLTGDILVNTYTNEFQIDPAVATLTDGSVIVVWSSFGQEPFTDPMLGVYGQRFTAEGAKVGEEFRINQQFRYNQRTASVAATDNGGFVVAWVTELQRGPASVDIYARLFNASGSASGNEFPVNTTTSNICANPVVAASLDGGFAVVWSQNDNIVRASEGTFNVSGGAGGRSSNGWDIGGRLYNDEAVASGSPVFLNTHRYGDQYGPRISAFGRDYLVVWTSLGQDTSWEGVFGQFLTSDGEREGVEFRVNSISVSRQIHPSVASDGANRFLALYSAFGAGTSFDLYGRAYDLIRLQVTSVFGGVKLSWNTQPGLQYQVQESLTPGVWTNVGGPHTATGLQDSITIEAVNTAANYRVVRVE